MLIRLPSKLWFRFINEFDASLSPVVWDTVSAMIDESRDIKTRNYFFSWMKDKKEC